MSVSDRRLVSLELNELNFDFVSKYCEMGELPAFARLMRNYQLTETVAEQAYPELEPWIQWPTVYTGKSYAEHGIFRLGDVVEKDHDQVWEVLERQGVSVGAISPMNASNRCRNPDFFVPDPWTVTKVSGEEPLECLYRVVRDLINSNSHEQRSMARLGAKLLPFVLRYALPSSAPQYARILLLAARYQWARAVFLDRFLADLMIRLREKNATRFTSLFLNAGAHIQHHYMFDSRAYEGSNRNPDWYSGLRKKGIDPLLFVYQTYDSILAELLRLPNTRLLVTTGLSQYPNERCIYQYRFKNYAAAIAKFGLDDFNVVPRMSRDFLLEFSSDDAAAAAENRLMEARIGERSLFAVENRGTSLFCQIAHFGEASTFEQVSFRSQRLDLSGDITLVSIENGLHRTTGFHIDTDVPATQACAPRIPLKQVFSKMRSAFEVEQPNRSPSAPETISTRVA